MAKKDLKRFFAPRSVAVIGASATKGRPGRVVIENMRANGYKGDIHPVNLRGGKLFGLRVFKTIKDLPSGIDLAIVILPAQATPQANPTAETEFRALLPAGVACATTRMVSADSNPDARLRNYFVDIARTL